MTTMKEAVPAKSSPLQLELGFYDEVFDGIRLPPHMQERVGKLAAVKLPTVC